MRTGSGSPVRSGEALQHEGPAYTCEGGGTSARPANGCQISEQISSWIRKLGGGALVLAGGGANVPGGGAIFPGGGGTSVWSTGEAATLDLGRRRSLRWSGCRPILTVREPATFGGGVQLGPGAPPHLGAVPAPVLVRSEDVLVQPRLALRHAAQQAPPPPPEHPGHKEPQWPRNTGLPSNHDDNISAGPRTHHESHAKNFTPSVKELCDWLVMTSSPECVCVFL